MERPGRREALRRALEHAAHLLPAQAPLDVFVHHNTLHAFQHLPFHDALSEAEAHLGASCYPGVSFYRDAFRRDRIRPEDLGRAIESSGASEASTPRGVPSRSELLKLLLIHDIRSTTAARLRWELEEHEVNTRFAPEVSAPARSQILVETAGWFRSTIAEGEDLVARFSEAVLGASGGPEVSRSLAALLGESPSRAAVTRALQRKDESVAVTALWTACRARTKRLDPPPARRAGSPRFHRELLLALANEDVAALVHPVLIPLCAAFLDRGQAHWAMPDRGDGFFSAWARVLSAGRAVRHAWLASLGKALRAWIALGVTAEDVALDVLDAFKIADGDMGPFVEATVLQLAGWAGMFHRLSQAPPTQAPVTLMDYLAVRLVLDALAVGDVCKRAHLPMDLVALRELAAERAPVVSTGDHVHAWALFMLAQHAGVSAPRVLSMSDAEVEGLCAFIHGADGHARSVLWHESYEAHYRDDLLSALVAHRADPKGSAGLDVQVITCIDDREESLHRHIEEVAPGYETLSAAGFFGLAIAYQGIDDPSTFPLCPVVLQPRHRIVEEAISDHAALAETRVRRMRFWARLQSVFLRASRSLVLAPFVTALSGFVATVPLLLQVFFPRAAAAIRSRAVGQLLPTPQTRLTAAREETEGAETESLLDGFTLDEKAVRVGTLLENMGMIDRFAPVVLVLGHDSSSANNPHFAAYSCGACGGRSGGPNARLFAHMANRREVRARLRERGIHIPDGTLFVGGVHDTCAEAVRVLDLDNVPKERAADVAAMRATLDEALRRNAHERSRRFASAPRSATAARALDHVRERSVDLSQARPELGHATNASCIVGRRALSRGLFLDRRAFLVSYDPTVDRDGSILERILMAVGPVGAGINLEYFFSFADNERLGAGTKLPHNVTGFVGVMDGASSDLRTGLPKQMIEVHEPVRLHMVIESTPDVLSAILDRAAPVADLVRKEWVRVATIDPDTGAVHTFDARKGFSRWTPGDRPVPVAHQSSDWYAGNDGFLAPARILSDPTSSAWHGSPDGP